MRHCFVLFVKGQKVCIWNMVSLPRGNRRVPCPGTRGDRPMLANPGALCGPALWQKQYGDHDKPVQKGAFYQERASTWRLAAYTGRPAAAQHEGSSPGGSRLGAVLGAGPDQTRPFTLGLGEIRGGVPVLVSKMDSFSPNSEKPPYSYEVRMQNRLHPVTLQMQKGRSALYGNVWM